MRPASRARARPRAARAKSQAAAPAGDLEHRADEDAVHVAHERVGLDVELEDVAVALPAARRDVALEALVVGLGRREGGEVVRCRRSAARAGVQRRLVDAVRPPQRAAALERRRRRGAPARGRGRCALRASWRAEKPVGHLLGRPAPTISSRQHGVDASAGAAAARRRRRPGRARGRRGRCGRRRSASTGCAQDGLERLNDLGGHRPPAGLHGPAREGAAVVRQVVELERLRPARGRPSRSRPTSAGRA